MGIFNDNIHNPHQSQVMTGPRGQPGPPGIGFKLTSNGNFNINNKRLTNVGAPTDDDDATTKEYVDDELNSKVANSQIMGGNAEAGKLVKYLPDKGMITPKMYIEDEFGDSVIIKSEDQDNDDVHLYIPNLKNYDGISGRRKSNIMVNSIDNNMTGKIILPSGNLMIKDGNDSTVLNRTDINKIFGSTSGQNGIITDKVPLYSSNGTVFLNTLAVKGESNNNFVIVRCRNPSGWRSLYIPSLNSNATIIVDQTSQTLDGDKTFARAVTMNQEGSANNHLVTKGYVDGHYNNYVKVDGSNMMTGDLNMNEKRVKNTLDPSDEQDTVNKRYLQSQLTDYLKRNGQNTMTFDLNMDNFKIVNLKKADNDTDAANKKYVDDEIAKIPSSPSFDSSVFLKKDGTIPMSGNLNLNNHKIINLNLNEPTSDSDATTKKYVDNKTRINPSHSLTNSFKYLMDDINEISTEYGLIADKIDDLSWSPHENKKVLYFKAEKDGLNYRYRLGFQMTHASAFANTIAIEQLFDNESYWYKAVISINGTGITIESSHTNKFHFKISQTNYYYTKTIVQLKRLIASEHQLYYTTHIDNIASSPKQLPLFLLAYGVNSFMSNVDSIVYNLPLFKNVNGKMQMKVDLDMNNKKIENLLAPTNNNDAVNLRFLELFTLSFSSFGNIPLLDDLEQGNLPLLNNMLFDENNKISTFPSLNIKPENIIRPDFSKTFIQLDGSKQPLLGYNKKLKKFYLNFSSNLMNMKQPSINLPNEFTMFIVIKTNNAEDVAHLHFTNDSSNNLNNTFRISLPGLNGDVVIINSLSQNERDIIEISGQSNILGNIELWTIRVTNIDRDRRKLEIFRGLSLTPIKTQTLNYKIKNNQSLFLTSKMELYEFLLYKKNEFPIFTPNNMLNRIFQYHKNEFQIND